MRSPQRSTYCYPTTRRSSPDRPCSSTAGRLSDGNWYEQFRAHQRLRLFKDANETLLRKAGWQREVFERNHVEPAGPAQASPPTRRRLPAGTPALIAPISRTHSFVRELGLNRPTPVLCAAASAVIHQGDGFD